MLVSHWKEQICLCTICIEGFTINRISCISYMFLKLKLRYSECEYLSLSFRDMQLVV